MSSARRVGPKPQSRPANHVGNSDKPPVQFLPPLKPKPTLAIVLLLVLVLWLIGLVLLRFKTVKPYVNPATAPATQ